MNKNIKLTHSFTPADLNNINLKIEASLNSEEFDEAYFLQLINQRDEVIQQHLTQLENQPLKDFAEAELAVNNELVELSKGMLSESLGNLSALIRGKKAVAKYK